MKKKARKLKTIKILEKTVEMHKAFFFNTYENGCNHPRNMQKQ